MTSRTSADGGGTPAGAPATSQDGDRRPLSVAREGERAASLQAPSAPREGERAASLQAPSAPREGERADPREGSAGSSTCPVGLRTSWAEDDGVPWWSPAGARQCIMARWRRRVVAWHVLRDDACRVWPPIEAGKRGVDMSGGGATVNLRSAHMQRAAKHSALRPERGRWCADRTAHEVGQAAGVRGARRAASESTECVMLRYIGDAVLRQPPRLYSRRNSRGNVGGPAHSVHTLFRCFNAQ